MEFFHPFIEFTWFDFKRDIGDSAYEWFFFYSPKSRCVLSVSECLIKSQEGPEVEESSPRTLQFSPPGEVRPGNVGPSVSTRSGEPRIGSLRFLA